jgi:hypothetical protein
MLEIVLALFISMSANAQKISSPNGYSGINIGSINILLTVPHDGYLMPDGWPNRTDKLGNIRRDSFTMNFTQAVSDELSALFLNRTQIAYRPFVAYSNIHRSEQKLKIVRV